MDRSHRDADVAKCQCATQPSTGLKDACTADCGLNFPEPAAGLCLRLTQTKCNAGVSRTAKSEACVFTQ